MCYRAKHIGCIKIVIMLLVVYAFEAHCAELVPPGRVGVAGLSSFFLLGNGAEVQSWEFISPGGTLIPDSDGDASPWENYLSNDATSVHAVSDPANAVLVDGQSAIDVGASHFGFFDFWYTNVGGSRVPGPIFPLSGVGGETFELVADVRDGTLKVVRQTDNPFGEGNWTYSYSIESPSAALIPDPDADAAPYLTYLSNTETLVSAATSNAVVIHDSLILDAKFTGSERDLIFHYEILGDEFTPLIWMVLGQGAVTYIPEPGTFALLAVTLLFCHCSRVPKLLKRPLSGISCAN